MPCLIHDHCVACSHAILEIVEPCLREEERKEALLLFQRAIAATLQSYERQRKRKERKLPRPSKN